MRAVEALWLVRGYGVDCQCGLVRTGLSGGSGRAGVGRAGDQLIGTMSKWYKQPVLPSDVKGWVAVV